MLTLEAVRITEAPSTRSGSAFCTLKSTPFTLRPNVSSYCCSVIDPNGSVEPPPALTNSTSMRPAAAFDFGHQIEKLRYVAVTAKERTELRQPGEGRGAGDQGQPRKDGCMRPVPRAGPQGTWAIAE